MLISLAFLFLLTPLHALQTTTSEQKNATETKQPTPHAISLNVTKPLTTTLNAKQKKLNPPTTSEQKNATETKQPTPHAISLNVTKPLSTTLNAKQKKLNPPTTSEQKNATETKQPTPHAISLDVPKDLTTALNAKQKKLNPPTTNEQKNATETSQPTLHAISLDVPKDLTTALNAKQKKLNPPTTSEQKNATGTNQPTPNAVNLKVLKPLTTTPNAKQKKLNPPTTSEQKNATGTNQPTPNAVSLKVVKPLTTTLNAKQKKLIPPTTSEQKNTTGTNQPTPHAISVNVTKPLTIAINTKLKKLNPLTTTEQKNATETKQPTPHAVNLKVLKSLTSTLNAKQKKLNPLTTTEQKNATETKQPTPHAVNLKVLKSLTSTLNAKQKNLIPPTTSEQKNATETKQPTPHAVNLKVVKPLTTTLNAKQKKLNPPTTSEQKNATGTNQPTPNAVSLKVVKPLTTTLNAKQKKLIPPTTSEQKNTTETKQPTLHAISLDVPKPLTTALNAKQKKQNPPTSTKINKVNQTLSSSTKPAPASSQKIAKDKTAPPAPQPIKVVITEGCIHKDPQADAVSSTKAQVTQLTLTPGSPLVMTHHINLVPGSCTVGCEVEMAALKGRVEWLEKEMVTMKKMCTLCSGGQCPNNCSDQGKCEEGTCVCLPSFSGPDCSSTTCPFNCNKKGKCVKGKCVCHQGYSGPDCSTGSDKKIKVEMVTLKVSSEGTIKESTSGKKTKVDKTLFQKKEQKKGLGVKTEGGKEGDSKAKTVVKAAISKTTVKQGDKAQIVKVHVHSNGTRSGKVVKTIRQVLLKHPGGRRQEQATKGKTTVIKLGSSKLFKPDLKLTVTTKQESANKSGTKKDILKDQSLILKDQSLPKGESQQQNVTQSSVMKSNGTSKVLVQLTKVTKTSVNITGTKVTKTIVTQGTNGTTKSAVKTISGKGKLPVTNVTSTEKDKKLFQANATVVLKGGPSGKKKIESHVNVTTIETKPRTKQSNRTSTKTGSLGSVAVQNITSAGFILTWEAPQGMFRNFTVTRRELRAGNEEKDADEVEEEAEKKEDGEEKVATDKGTIAGNVTEVQKPSSNRTSTAVKRHSGPSGRGDGKNARKSSQVLSGTVRSQQFRNLRPQTRYSVSVFGFGPGLRSKTHRLTATTGPEPPTELVFINVTESSLSVSWTKPKNTVTGFKVSYINSATGETGSMTVDSQLSHVLLSKLAPGSSYEVNVTSTLEMDESNALTATVITVPDSPTNLQPINVTDTKALLTWKPAQAKVDRYILSYGSTKSPNVTVTVMVSGNSVDHQLRGLHRSTLYTVKAMSQVNSLQSITVTTTFTTASGVKPQIVVPSEVTSNSAVISWKTTRLVFKSYRLTYQLVGQVAKEVILNPTVTQYQLTGLLAQSNYTVRVEGEKDGQYIIVVSTELTTEKLRFPFPQDCSQVQLNGVLESGEEEIYPEGEQGEPVWVYCDMATDGGGWTVFQRRIDGKTDFYRSWKDYSKGFGLLSTEFWLGNDVVHTLTSLRPVSLRVDLRAGNDSAYAHYANFSIGSEANNYAIEVSGYSGTAGDSMRYHNGRPFSTKDKDPNPLSIHCARAYMGGWWYKNCYKANLNGLYATFSENQGVVWIDWKGKDSSIPFTEMKLRRASFTQATQS